MVAMAVAGVGVALGLIGIVRTIWPARESLASLIGELESHASEDGRNGSYRGPDARALGSRGGLRYELGLRGARVLATWHWEGWVAPCDLAIDQKSMPELCAQALGSMFALACVPVFIWAFGELVGVTLPVFAPAWGVLACALVGLLMPVLELKSRAARRREHFRRALSAFLGLVAMAQAGGMGIEGALLASANVSDDWAFVRMRRAIDTARGLQVTPWEALGALGEEIGVEEMVELSLHIGLAGREGARVRASLAAKADSLRRREMAREEAQANAITEKMFLPGVVLMAGFMVFIGYPALESVFRAA